MQLDSEVWQVADVMVADQNVRCHVLYPTCYPPAIGAY